jgi:hypothetical protein
VFGERYARVFGVCVVVAVAASACGGSSGKSGAAPSSSAVGSSLASVTPSVSPTPSPKPTVSPAVVIADFMGLIGRDLAQEQSAAKYVLPNSPAARYVAFQIAGSVVDQDSGAQGNSASSTTTKISDRAWKLCDGTGAQQTCVQFDNFKLAGGKIESFNTAGEPIGMRLAVTGAPSTMNAVTLAGVGAYRSGQGTPSLIVLADITNVSAQDLAVLNNSAQYQEPDGTQMQTGGSTGQLTLHPGSKGHYSFYFNNASAGGMLFVQVSIGNTQGGLLTLPLKVG